MAATTCISTLKLNFSPVRGSILMQFISLEPPEFILLAIEFSLKSARFLAMPRRGRYYVHVKTEFLACPWVNFNAVYISIEPPEFILLPIEFSLKSVAKCIFCDSLKS